MQGRYYIRAANCVLSLPDPHAMNPTEPYVNCEPWLVHWTNDRGQISMVTSIIKLAELGKKAFMNSISLYQIIL